MMATAFTNAMDTFTPTQVGENGHVEHGWSHDLSEAIVQLNFQLVRCDPSRAEELGNKYYELLQRAHHFMESATDSAAASEYYRILLRIPAATRDIDSGKGEWHLSYVLLDRLLRVNPEFGRKTFTYFVHDIPVEGKSHPFGSWKDVKAFWAYLNDRPANPLFPDHGSFFIQLINDQIRKDAVSDKPSLCARWVPREKSKHGALFKLLAENYFANYIESASRIRDSERSAEVMKRAKRKAYMDYSNIIVRISGLKLDTPQVKMCGKNWSGISIDNLTSVTMRKQSRALQNIKKDGSQRSSEEDRIVCGNNFTEFTSKVVRGEAKAKGKRVGLIDYLRDACSMMQRSCYYGGMNTSYIIKPNEPKEQIDLINSQWEDFESQIGDLPPMFCMCDTSGSMGTPEDSTGGQNNPLLAALGLSIIVSNKSSMPQRVLSFNSEPAWIDLENKKTFMDKAIALLNGGWGGTTNFYKALDMILDCAIQNKIPASVMSEMILVIFSDMQINNAGPSLDSPFTRNRSADNTGTMLTVLKEKYHQGGIRAVGQPYDVPHIFFWNLRSTDGFPTLSTAPNASMCSGFSPLLLKTFYEKGIEEMKKITPWSQLTDQISNPRYNIDSF